LAERKKTHEGGKNGPLCFIVGGGTATGSSVKREENKGKKEKTY